MLNSPIQLESASGAASVNGEALQAEPSTPTQGQEEVGRPVLDAEVVGLAQRCRGSAAYPCILRQCVISISAFPGHARVQGLGSLQLLSCVCRPPLLQQRPPVPKLGHRRIRCRRSSSVTQQSGRPPLTLRHCGRGLWQLWTGTCFGSRTSTRRTLRMQSPWIQFAATEMCAPCPVSSSGCVTLHLPVSRQCSSLRLLALPGSAAIHEGCCPQSVCCSANIDCVLGLLHRRR